MVSIQSLFLLCQRKVRMVFTPLAGGLSHYAISLEADKLTNFLFRILESMTRAFNNLTERLHASFLLYLLPEPFQFLPVATYLSAPILIGAALTIAGLRIWRNLNSKASMSLLAMFVTYAIGGLLLSLDRMQVSSDRLDSGSHSSHSSYTCTRSTPTSSLRAWR